MRYHGPVTVIIPICNRQQLLDKTLLSLFSIFRCRKRSLGIQNIRFNVCLFMDSGKTLD
jgi:hypothetical protein